MAKMLLVDNDKDMCQVIRDILQDEGHTIDIAYNGKSALRKIKKNRYRLVILDNKLAGISGLTVLDKIRRIKPSMRTIMISGYGDSSTRSRAKALGVSDFLDKPFDIKKFTRVITKVVKGTQRRP